jgi:hypothetical protein
MAPSLFPRTSGQSLPGAGSGSVHLRLVRPGALDLDHVRRLLDTPGWLGAAVAPEQPGMRRFVTDLVLPLRAGRPRTIFRKAAYVDLGEPSPIDGGLSVAIGWRSSTLAPLFPVFAGRLEVRRDALVLEGWYAPPGGEAGRILDRAFLNIAARGTARWFLDHVGAVLAAPVGGPAPAPEGLQPR